MRAHEQAHVQLVGLAHDPNAVARLPAHIRFADLVIVHAADLELSGRLKEHVLAADAEIGTVARVANLPATGEKKAAIAAEIKPMPPYVPACTKRRLESSPGVNFFSKVRAGATVAL